MNWKKTCRVCLQSGDVVSLFDWDDNNELLRDKYTFCCGVEVPTDDTLPTLICLNCVDLLAVAYEFKKECLSSNETLQECLDEFLKSSVSVSSGLSKVPETETITIKQDNGVELEYALPVETDSQWTITNTKHSAVVTKAPGPRKVGRPRKYPDIHGEIKLSRYTSKKSNLSKEEQEAMESQLASIREELKQRHELETDSAEDIVETETENQENGVELEQSAVVTKAPGPRRVGRPRKHPNKHEEIKISQIACESNLELGLMVSQQLVSGEEESEIRQELETDSVEEDFDMKSEVPDTFEEIIIEQEEDEEEASIPRKRGRPRSLKRQQIEDTVDAVLKATVKGYVPPKDEYEKETPILKPKPKKKPKPIKVKRLEKKKYFYDKMHKCETCGAAFPSNAKLQEHIRRHLGIKPYSCSICSYNSPVYQNLKRHLLIHTNLKPYKCTLCPKAYKDSGDLTKHMRTHSGIRPFQCKICKKTFTYSSVLTSHMATHARDEKLECKLCHKKFKRANHLKYHNRVHHKTKIKEKAKPQPPDKHTGVLTAEIVDGFVTVFHRLDDDDTATEVVEEDTLEYIDENDEEEVPQDKETTSAVSYKTNSKIKKKAKPPPPAKPTGVLTAEIVDGFVTVLHRLDDDGTATEVVEELKLEYIDENGEEEVL